MTDFPRGETLPLFVSSIVQFSPVSAAQGYLASANTAAFNWPAEKEIIYIPMSIPWSYPVNRVFWANGSTVTSNNDFGIYTKDGARLYSTGSTTAVGVSQCQFVTPGTPFVLAPGDYYFGLSMEGTVTNRAHGFSTVAAAEGRMVGLLQQLSTFPLPSTATFAAWASTGVPLCGITRTASGF